MSFFEVCCGGEEEVKRDAGFFVVSALVGSLYCLMMSTLETAY
jgi:hypothetical protein